MATMMRRAARTSSKVAGKADEIERSTGTPRGLAPQSPDRRLGHVTPELLRERAVEAEPDDACLDLILRRMWPRPDRARDLDGHVREEERDHNHTEDHGEQLNKPLPDEHDEVALVTTHQPSPSPTR